MLSEQWYGDWPSHRDEEAKREDFTTNGTASDNAIFDMILVQHISYLRFYFYTVNLCFSQPLIKVLFELKLFFIVKNESLKCQKIQYTNVNQEIVLWKATNVLFWQIKHK